MTRLERVEALHSSNHGLLYQIVGVQQVAIPSREAAAGPPPERRKTSREEAIECIAIAGSGLLHQFERGIKGRLRRGRHDGILRRDVSTGTRIVHGRWASHGEDGSAGRIIRVPPARMKRHVQACQRQGGPYAAYLDHCSRVRQSVPSLSITPPGPELNISGTDVRGLFGRPDSGVMGIMRMAVDAARVRP